MEIYQMDEDETVSSVCDSNFDYISRDYTPDFSTTQVFDSREELLAWILEVAQDNGFKTVITRLMKQRGKIAPKLFVGCERSGRPRINGKDGGVKCNCPFKLQGLNVEGTDKWKLEVCHGMHNHEMLEHCDGEELNLPGSLTRMQFLLKKLRDEHYVVFLRSEEDENRLTDIVWAHPFALRLVKTFPWVLVMDCTVRTKKHMFPLFECVGVTSTMKTFYVAHAFICGERQDSLEWVVNHIRSFLSDDQLPRCIVTDRDLELMNAVKKSFPTSANLLCTWHINKNISVNCKNYFNCESSWQAFFLNWKQVMYSRTVPEYFHAVAQLKTRYGTFYKEVLEYLQETWLIPHHHQFIQAWTDQVFHLGNTTIQRTTQTMWSIRVLMKKYIENYNVDLDAAWNGIHEAMKDQHSKLRESFERAMMMRRHVYAAEKMYDLLQGRVSEEALEKIHKQKVLAELDLRRNEVETFCKPCPIIAKKGLPCRHMIANWITQGVRIPLKSIHPHWRCLTLEENNHLKPTVRENNCGRPPSQSDLTSARDTSEILTSMREALSQTPLLTTNVPGLTTVSTTNFESHKQLVSSRQGKGRGRAAKNLRLRLDIYRAKWGSLLCYFIEDVIDVGNDSHCVFSCVAAAILGSENAWVHVSRDLIRELEEHEALYAACSSQVGYVQKLIDICTCPAPQPPESCSIELPALGPVIASRYGVVVHSISSTECHTYLPMRRPPIPTISRRHITLGSVNGNHWVQVFWKEPHPVPPILEMCLHQRLDIAKGWEDAYTDDIKLWHDIVMA